MNQKNEHKDNIIIALSVALVVAVLCCSVLGVIIGLGGDVKAGAEVAEAYYSSPTSPETFNTFNWNGYLYYYFNMDISAQDLGELNMEFGDVADYIGLYDLYWKIPAYYIVTYNIYFEEGQDQWAGYTSLATYSSMTSSAPNVIDYYPISGGLRLNNQSFTCYSSDLTLIFINDGFDTLPTGSVEVEVEITRIVVGYFDIQAITDDFADEGYRYGYDDGYVTGNEEGLLQGYNNGYADGNQVGYDDGYRVGRAEGFSDGVEQAGDYTFFSLITSVFDAPLRVILGQWVDVNGDGVVDELRGGFLNFYVPVLDIDLAPLIISLFTVCIIIIVIRFVLARL